MKVIYIAKCNSIGEELEVTFYSEREILSAAQDALDFGQTYKTVVVGEVPEFAPARRKPR